MKRECLACDGQGRQLLYSAGRVVGDKLCPACNGARYFSDRIPAADAMADADTLRGVVVELRTKSEAGALRNNPVAMDAFNAAASVEWSLRRVDSHEDKLWPPCAELAARAAFRAVPGLRGDR